MPLFRPFVAVVALAAMVAAAPVLAGPQSLVVFPFELIDSSLDGQMLGTTEAEKARLEKMAPRLREALAASGRYAILDLGAGEADARAQNLQACGGCDAKIAKSVGAELAVTGTVQKVSNLILNVNIYVRDVATGKIVGAGSADIRSNTDQSWFRGLDWLVAHRILGSKRTLVR